MKGKVYKKSLEQGRQSDFLNTVGTMKWYEKVVVYINEDTDAEDSFLTVILSCPGCPLSICKTNTQTYDSDKGAVLSTSYTDYRCTVTKKFSVVIHVDAASGKEIPNIPSDCPLWKNEFAVLEMERPSISKTSLYAALYARGIYFVALFNYYGDTPVYIVYSTRYSLQQIKETLVEILV